MVHPTQQTPPFGQQKSPSLIAVMRNGKTRIFRVRPWLAACVLSFLVLFLTAYVGATAYLLYRDDLLGATLARQVGMQYAYEDRIAALRAEIDRVTSRHVVETQGVEDQIAALLDRQAVIESRQSALGDLMAKASGAGVAVAADFARPPRASPDVQATGGPAPADGVEPLAFAPAAPDTDDIITGTLIRGSDGSSDVRLHSDLKPLLSNVRSALDDAQNQQSETLDSLSTATQSEADRVSSALAPVGVTTEVAVSEGPQGGPYIPATGMHFVERTAILNRALDDIASARRKAAAMPLGVPVVAKSISSRFGYRMDPFLNRPALHAGLDFVATTGVEVRATAPGVVVAAERNGGYGQMVEIAHAGGLSTRYAHLSSILVSRGERVSAGTPIGRVGSTGRSTGPHLHYETRRDGKAVNPAIYLAAGRALRER